LDTGDGRDLWVGEENTRTECCSLQEPRLAICSNEGEVRGSSGSTFLTQVLS
jgi:hypothetical protein